MPHRPDDDARCATPTDHLTTLIGQIRRASSAAEIQALLQVCVAPLGADQAYFVTFVRDDHDLVICRYLLACDARWCRLYLAGGDDSVRGYAYQSLGIKIQIFGRNEG